VACSRLPHLQHSGQSGRAKHSHFPICTCTRQARSPPPTIGAYRTHTPSLVIPMSSCRALHHVPTAKAGASCTSPNIAYAMRTSSNQMHILPIHRLAALSLRPNAFLHPLNDSSPSAPLSSPSSPASYSPPPAAAPRRHPYSPPSYPYTSSTPHTPNTSE
jgi:hypothetical protein